jgi:hypothetical protein
MYNDRLDNIALRYGLEKHRLKTVPSEKMFKEHKVYKSKTSPAQPQTYGINPSVIQAQIQKLHESRKTRIDGILDRYNWPHKEIIKGKKMVRSKITPKRRRRYHTRSKKRKSRACARKVTVRVRVAAHTRRTRKCVR